MLLLGGNCAPSAEGMATISINHSSKRKKGLTAAMNIDTILLVVEGGTWRTTVTVTVCYDSAVSVCCV